LLLQSLDIELTNRDTILELKALIKSYVNDQSNCEWKYWQQKPDWVMLLQIKCLHFKILYWLFQVMTKKDFFTPTDPMQILDLHPLFMGTVLLLLVFAM